MFLNQYLTLEAQIILSASLIVIVCVLMYIAWKETENGEQTHTKKRDGHCGCG